MIDYTSLERDDLMIYAEGNGQLDYVQREVYAGSERIEQFTDRSNGGYERTLYVHEDVQGNTRYYTKTNGNSFAELTYDAWGMPVSPNKLLNNDHGNYVYATYTGHIFDTTLDIYFAEARFYDAQTRTWLAMDPIKDGGNWYQYCFSNPLKYWDPTGLVPIAAAQQNGFSQYGGCQGIPYAARWQDPNNPVIITSYANISDFLMGTLALTGGAIVIVSVGLPAMAAGGAVLIGAAEGSMAVATVTVTAGALTAAFGASDALEGAQYIYRFCTDNNIEPVNFIRDNVSIFREHPWLYTAVEFVVGVTAAKGANILYSARTSENAYPSPKDLIGHDFEDYLTETIGGDGSFSAGGREFDGGIGNRWWEAKSGNYWDMLENNPRELAKFKSDMGNRLQIANENGATYELFSNRPIPQSIKLWLEKKGIPFTELLD